MKNSSHKASSLTRIMRGLFISAFIMAMMGLSTQARAVTAAGTVIQNQALVEYTDEQGNAQEARSNWARISVKQIYSATIFKDITDLKAGSNQTVYFQHTLTNTGNGTDTYHIAVSQDHSTGGADAGDFIVLKIFGDLNSNGQIDAGEDLLFDGQATAVAALTGVTTPALASAATWGSLDLEAGQFVSLVVEAQVPTLLSGQEVDLTVKAIADGDGATATTYLVDDLTTAQGIDTLDYTNEDTITVTTDAALNVNKSYTVVEPTYAYNGDGTVTVTPGTITYVITVTNTGLKDAQSVVVWDGIPFNAEETSVNLISNVGFGEGTTVALGPDVDANDKEIQQAILGSANDGEADLNCGLGGNANFGGAGCVLNGADAVPNTAANSTETLLGTIDINNDGDTSDDNLRIVYGYDDVLPVNSTISYSYSVTFNNHRNGLAPVGTGTGTIYDADSDGTEDTVIAPGDLIPNRAYVSASLDGDTTPDSIEESNRVVVEVPAYPAVVALDTNDGASTAGTIVADNDGGDDDGDNSGNDDLPLEDASQEAGQTGSADNQLVDRAATSMVVKFKHDIYNNGNGEDTFDLTIVNNTFPPGTTFTWFDDAGTLPLLDTDFDGIRDTGPMAAGATKTVTVFAHLPDTISVTEICDSDGSFLVGADTGTSAIKLHQNNTPGTTGDDFYFYDEDDDCNYADAAADYASPDDDYFKATITATSSVKKTDDSLDSDTTVERLGKIMTPGVDLANGTANTGGSTTTTDNTDNAAEIVITTDDDDVNFLADLNSSVSQMNSVGVGETTTFQLLVTNDSAQEDSFQIYAGRGVNTDDIFDNDESTLVDENDLMSMWAGWNVVFTDSATPGAGSVITTTPSISLGETYTIYAHVTTSPVITESRADLVNFGTTTPLDVDIDNADGIAAGALTYQATDNPSDGDVTANTERLDANGDNKGEYPIFFLVVSTNTNAYNFKLDAVQVTELEDVVLINDREGQVQPGGSIDYPHVLKNVGNTNEIFMLTDNANIDGVQGQGNSATDWSNVLYVMVDTSGTCNGTVAAGTRDWKPWSLLTHLDDVVIGTDAETSTTCQDYYDTDGDGNWDADATPASMATQSDGLLLEPNEELPIKVRVFSPSSAPNGTEDVLNVLAPYNITGPTAGNYSTEGTSNIDKTTVILGQLRIYKTVAPDVDCTDAGGHASNGAPDAGVTFTEAHATLIEPSDCAVWQLLVINEGDTNADNVIVYDAAPEYSAIVDADYFSDDLLTGASGKPALDDDATETYFMRSCKLDGAVAVNDALNRVEDVACATGNIQDADKAHNFQSDDVGGGAVGNTVADTNVFAKSDLAGNVTFYVGIDNPKTGAVDPAADGVGGTLLPGHAYLIRFSTQVE